MKEADEAGRILIDELNRSFVTPFEREDILGLERSIDDVMRIVSLVRLTSAFVIMTASSFGLPVSTSPVVSLEIIGIGASERFGKVRWSVADDILIAWLITIPASALLPAGACWLTTNAWKAAAMCAGKGATVAFTPLTDA